MPTNNCWFIIHAYCASCKLRMEKEAGPCTIEDQSFLGAIFKCPKCKIHAKVVWDLADEDAVHRLKERFRQAKAE